jgi:DNA mismatch repair ATPase MutS
LALRTGLDAKIVAAVVSRWQGVFSQLANALRLVEELELEAPLLRELRSALLAKGARASVELARLDHILGWFALRESEWGHAAINVLSCWDIHCLWALERWQSRSGRQLAAWLEALGRVEALSSLAGAAHDNPEFTFPELVAAPAVFDAVALGHPLLAPDGRVTNDVCLPGPGRALLVTGSNMSGKSTLLRAMGLASVMAFAGAPVCASRLRISPFRVHTSVRVNDSLSEGVSRFYAELERLRRMLAATRGGVPVLYLIDEILAGTNSVERCIGARWLLGELSMAGALGAVSTHDTQLCQLPHALMARFEQVHFQESVDDTTLTFDYRLRPGPVRAGNAVRLMRSLGLAIP